ncbi:MAG: 2-amino-4-hydroxy-6-hydroxymethyldihydropteridine diphosphokinase [Bacteroidia bacterium]|nr:2-amino-4-hydroxy-6-hydroxymethyldihydropteridine diphosphokinase [Bacteroidia bacterium]NNF32324.1 2-amino-4-hydroxy-6-hydroxymethyldihydropteridine diphosphokinase [Flavobacteriaceae bacterium]MBT8276124.1 2-amino-4-hydroxy-6-hydroxymethyldihydropteridine diphosphokinase [Bacteroidia bacterium]NNJ81991.1 2-amino-4-hydroxy-6-hydroxymethyldihydropteridine diphosphokinase [Flavobacteriaceae bacterium]NNK53950.1 2-amino-4-hydroxy-6-hydroxymethyldihydropteridine diphosphokinase [Flavobacteriace
MNKPLQHAYLSLGSNMGNKFEHLQKAVNCIFEEVGALEKISSVYRTPAMGFEGEDFLNCVLWVKTGLTPNKILEAVLSIEKSMGRERTTSKSYRSRPIDIDILFVDDIQKKTKKLTLPHPELENRRFVLQPMAEVNPQFEHPASRKNMIRLLADTMDESAIEKQSKWLRNPRKDYDLAQYNYIAVEGNIGAGKTSLASKLAGDFNAKLILERFKDNPFLPKFYEDQVRYAFPLEMSFLADRYQQLLEDITQFDLFKDCVIADYDVYKSLIFAKVTLAEEEFNVYKKLFHIMHKELPKPDIYVYLYQKTDRLIENIKKRGRSYEKNIKEEYLQKIHDGYFEFIKTQHMSNIRIVDITDKDFVNNRKDYLSILKEMLH